MKDILKPGEYVFSDKSVVIEGLGKDAPATANKYGGRQSVQPYRFDLIDAKALFAMAKVLKEGAEKYGEDNWRLITVPEHLNHLLAHVYAYIAGDSADEHLNHALCRALFAVAVNLQTEDDVKIAKFKLNLEG